MHRYRSMTFLLTLIHIAAVRDILNARKGLDLKFFAVNRLKRD